MGGILNIVKGIFGGKTDAEKAAERQAQINADIEKQNTAEEKRRLEEDIEYRDSLARAAAAATGVGGDTTNIYLESLEESGADELNWLDKVGASKYNAAIAAGDVASAQAASSNFGNFMSLASIGMGFLPG